MADRCDQFANISFKPGTTFCNSTYDGYLCWPPTLADEEIFQSCPPVRLSDTTKLAYRKCGAEGIWLGKYPNDTTQVGWTNYTSCFTPLVQTLLKKVYNDSDSMAERKFAIAQSTRYMEIIGFSISLVSLIISLTIFSYYRALRNHRTRIHKCLFITMIIQVLIRLTVYIDQALVRTHANKTEYENDTRGIDNMSYLCESSYVLLEYTNTCMFMWMFVEGLYLYNMVTANVLRVAISYVVYYIIGWGLPVIVTAIWATLTALHYRAEVVNRCWYGYNFSRLYWILEGPRMCVIMFNMVFLLSIMRVLIVKLRRSTSSEIEKIRKAVRGALILLPLLGITNVVNMIEAPLDGSVWSFALWSFTSHFLRSFQGFFITIIYCFMNAEVRQAIRKHYDNFKTIQQHRQQRGQRGSQRDSAIELQPIKQKNVKEPKLRMKWTRPVTTTANVSETDFGAGSSQENKMTGLRYSEASAVSATVHTELENTLTGESSLPTRRPRCGTPRHHGVIVRNIKMPYAPRTWPPKDNIYD